MTAKKFLLSLTCCLSMSSAYANPVPDNVAAGKVDMSATTSHLQIHQQTPEAIINWRSFNIAPHESVHFQQPPNAWVLNRISPTQGASVIAGQLSSTANIVLSNAAGIHFTNSARVDVGGLLATTANIADRDFLARNFIFYDNSGRNGSVTNAGRIHAADHGFVAFLAPHTKNEGKVTAHLGQIHHYSTTKYVMKVGDNNLVHFAVDADTLKETAHAKNMMVDNDKVLLNGKGAKHVLDNAVKRDKDGEANYAYLHNGNLVLSAKHDIRPEQMNHNITVGVVHTKPAANTAKAEEKSEPGCIPVPVATSSSSGSHPAAPSSQPTGVRSSATVMTFASAPFLAPTQNVEIPLPPIAALNSEYQIIHTSAQNLTSHIQENYTNNIVTASVPARPATPPSPTFSMSSDSGSEFEMVNTPVSEPVSPVSSGSNFEIINAPDPDLTVDVQENYVNIDPTHSVVTVTPPQLFADRQYVALSAPEPMFSEITEEGYVHVDPLHIVQESGYESPELQDSPPVSPSSLRRLVENFDSLPEQNQHALSQLSEGDLYLMQPIGVLMPHDEAPSPMPSSPASPRAASPVLDVLPSINIAAEVVAPEIIPVATAPEVVRPAPVILPVAAPVEAGKKSNDAAIDAPILLTTVALLLYLLDSAYDHGATGSSGSAFSPNYFFKADITAPKPLFKKSRSLNFQDCLLMPANGSSLDKQFQCIIDDEKEA